MSATVSVRSSVPAPEGIEAPPVRVVSVTVDPDRFLDAFLWLLALDSDAQDAQDGETAA